MRYRSKILHTTFSSQKVAHFLAPPISDHYRMWLSYKLNYQNFVLVWKKFIFKHISLNIIAYSCHTNSTIKIQSLCGKIGYLTRHLHEIWHILLSKITVQLTNIFFKLDHYCIQLSCKLFTTFLFISYSAVRIKPVKGIRVVLVNIKLLLTYFCQGHAIILLINLYLL